MSLSKTFTKASTIPRAFIIQQLIQAPDTVNGAAFFCKSVCEMMKRCCGCSTRSDMSPDGESGLEDKIGNSSGSTAGSTGDQGAAEDQKDAKMDSRALELYKKLEEYYALPSVNFKPTFTETDNKQLKEDFQEYKDRPSALSGAYNHNANEKAKDRVENAICPDRDSIPYECPTQEVLKEIAACMIKRRVSEPTADDTINREYTVSSEEIPALKEFLQLGGEAHDNIRLLVRFRFSDDEQASDPEFIDKFWRILHVDKTARRRYLLPLGCSTPFFDGKTLFMANERSGYWTSKNEGKNNLYHTHITYKLLNSYNEFADRELNGVWKPWLNEVEELLGFKKDSLLRMMLIFDVIQ